MIENKEMIEKIFHIKYEKSSNSTHEFKDENGNPIIITDKILKVMSGYIEYMRQQAGYIPFITGEGGVKDEYGFPEYFIVCQFFGSDISVFYKKHGKPSNPGF